MLIDPDRQLVGVGKGVKAARLRIHLVDVGLRKAVIDEAHETDAFAGFTPFRRQFLQCAWFAGKKRAEIHLR